MSPGIIGILILLGFIAYKLHQINERGELATERDREKKEQEKVDRKIKALLPHFFTDIASDETIKELREFYSEQEAFNEADSERDLPIPFKRYYEEMEDMIREEQDKRKKKAMERRLQQIKKNGEEMMKKIKQFGEPTSYELQFVLWRYYYREWLELNSTEIESDGSSLDSLIVDSYVDVFSSQKKPTRKNKYSLGQKKK